MRKHYKARREAIAGATIKIITDQGERALPPRTDLVNHSPTGFEWGYAGSGPAQLALALCVDALDGNKPRTGPCFSQRDECFLGGVCVCGLSGEHNRHECKRCGDVWERTELARARAVYQEFKFRHIAGQTENEWTMTAEEVRRGIAEIEQERLSPKSKSGVTA